MHFWTLKNILTHLNFHIVPYKKAFFSLYQSSGIFQNAINFILSDLSMAFENRRQLTWKQRDTKYWRTNAINSKLSRQIWTPPLQSPSQCNMVSVAATRALNDWAPPSPQRYQHQHHDCDRHHRDDWTAPTWSLQDLTIIMAVIAKHHLLSISYQPMLKEEQTKGWCCSDFFFCYWKMGENLTPLTCIYLCRNWFTS